MARLEGAVARVDEVHGFRYFDSRDLLGFVDGTENPTGQEAVDATIIGEEDPAFTIKTMIVQELWPGATVKDTIEQVTDRNQSYGHVVAQLGLN